MRWIQVFGAVALAAALSACGGGGADDAVIPQPAAARIADELCTDAAIASGEAQQVQGQCVRATPILGRAKPVPPSATLPPLTPNQLMSWAEQNYPSYFPPGTGNAGFLAPYVYRHYPQTGFYLGVSVQLQDVAIYVLFPDGQFSRVGALADYTCTVLPQNCVVPSAPTINNIVAGDSSASIAFSAPSTNGGAAITRYTAECTSPSLTTGVGTSTIGLVKVTSLQNGAPYSCSVTATNSFGTGPASLAVSVTPSAPSTGSVTGTVSTAGAYCGYTSSVYNANTSVKGTSTVSITCDGALRQIAGNGLPDHPVGTYPNSDNDEAIVAQAVQSFVTLTPQKQAASTPAPLFGYAVNGVRFDARTGASCSVSGQQVSCNLESAAGPWQIEGLGQSKFALGIDEFNGNVNADGAYSYVGVPLGLMFMLGRGTELTLVGFALDGFPVYAKYGYTDPLDSASLVKTLPSGWKLKTVPASGRPSTTTYPMGAFTQDYEFVGNADGLDMCNGRFGVTPEFPGGIYHYTITDNYPYIPRCLMGSAGRP